jgi:hypothetical protein
MNQSLSRGIPGSFVKILNCNFTSYDDDVITIALVETGKLNAEKFNFTRRNRNSTSVGLVCLGHGNMVVVDCFICDNGFAGLLMHEDFVLVKDSRLHNNGTIGLCKGPEASKCVAVNCDIHQSEHAGIGIANSKNVTLIRNNVFDK